MSDPLDPAELAERFDAARSRLVRVAYAILGSVGEAEDVVAQTWLRLADAHTHEPVRDVEGWSVVAVSRAALDTYRSARRRREVYVGPWLPEPMVTALAGAADSADPADRATRDDSVSFALLVVLESLSPAERTAWVLHDLFGLEFTEVAEVVGRRPDAVRRLASRARTHLRDRAPRYTADAQHHREVVQRFLSAAAGGRLGDLVTVLDPDVVLTADGGGVVSAARRPVRGADRVARFLLGIAAKADPDAQVRLLDVNGLVGIGLYSGDRLTDVLSLGVQSGVVTRVDIVRAPGKLASAGAVRPSGTV